MTAASTRTLRAGRLVGARVGVFAAGLMAAGLTVLPTTGAAATSRVAAARPAAETTAGATLQACPAAPPRPPASGDYRLDGQLWNAADPIDWTIDTVGLAAARIAPRVADIRRALRDAARDTGFHFVYEGRVTRVRTQPPPFLLQFSYVKAITGPFAGSLGEQTNDYIPGTRKQTVDAHITLLSSLVAGYGRYDARRPVASAEGDVLLHEVAAVLGLRNVSTTPPEVMSWRAGRSDYFSAYQAGDRMGLWRVGASRGCRHFPA